MQVRLVDFETKRQPSLDPESHTALGLRVLERGLCTTTLMSLCALRPPACAFMASPTEDRMGPRRDLRSSLQKSYASHDL
jgi:hypothetical protein